MFAMPGNSFRLTDPGIRQVVENLSQKLTL
jgi:hypothetical protein